MQDRQPYAEILGILAPWFMDRVELKLADGEVQVHYERPARKHFRWRHGWAVRSRLQPRAETARMLKRRLGNILTYLRHRITNAASESINSKIQWVKHTARGFRNKRDFQIAIYFHWGGLDMTPSCH